MNKITKYVLIIVLAGLLGCDKDDDKTEACTCTGKFTTEENFGDGTYFYVSRTPIDCETRQYTGSDGIQDNAVFISCTD